MSIARSVQDSVQRERYCILAIYGVPVLLALIAWTVPMLIGYFQIAPPGVRRDFPIFVFFVNGFIAGMASATGEVFRRGSLVRRVTGGVLYLIVGTALYGTMFGVILMIYEQLVIH